MKRILTFMLTMAGSLVSALAMVCDVCQKQQPRILRGIAHGAGPQSDWDYVAVAGIAIVALISFVYALMWIIRPGERESNHIKRTILKYDEL